MMEPLSGYDVGALMYCPAHGHGAIVDALRREQYPKPFSLAFCLEATASSGTVSSRQQARAKGLGYCSRPSAATMARWPWAGHDTRAPTA